MGPVGIEPTTRGEVRSSYYSPSYIAAERNEPLSRLHEVWLLLSARDSIVAVCAQCEAALGLECGHLHPEPHRESAPS